MKTSIQMKKNFHRMYFAKYLLSIGEFLGEKNGEALLKGAFSCLDDTRREKAEHMRPGRAQAASVGAGLLLQLAVGEAVRAMAGEGKAIEQYSVSQLLERLKDMPPIPLVYEYGKKGKPYFKELPFFFNLSHSGDYVVCGLADVEIGADIQRHQAGNSKRLSKRFFSEQEIAALEASGEDEALFFRLWARKEAYGKLTGDGIAGALEMNLLPEENLLPGEERRPDGRRLVWEEYKDIMGYSIAFCRYREKEYKSPK